MDARLCVHELVRACVRVCACVYSHNNFGVQRGVEQMFFVRLPRLEADVAARTKRVHVFIVVRTLLGSVFIDIYVHDDDHL